MKTVRIGWTDGEEECFSSIVGVETLKDVFSAFQWKFPDKDVEQIKFIEILEDEFIGGFKSG